MGLCRTGCTSPFPRIAGQVTSLTRLVSSADQCISLQNVHASYTFKRKRGKKGLVTKSYYVEIQRNLSNTGFQLNSHQEQSLQ